MPWRWPSPFSAGKSAERATFNMKPKAVMTKRGKQIVIGLVVFIVMTMLAILLGLGPVVSSAA